LSSSSALVVVKPNETSSESITSISNTIIQRIIKTRNLEIIGISSAVPAACIAVCRAKELGNIHVINVALDYLDYPAIGKLEAILIAVSIQQPSQSVEERMRELDAGMNLSFTPEGQTIAVPRSERADKILMITLSKLRRFDRLKILAAGSTINTAANLALEVTRSGIAKEQTGIEYVGLTSIQSKIQQGSAVPSLAVYLRKGVETVIDPIHNQLREVTTAESAQ